MNFKSLKISIDVLSLKYKEYGLIGNYWEKGKQNKIDIVAIDELEKKIYFAKLKLNKDKIKIPKLKDVEKNLANVKRLIEIFPVVNIKPAVMDT